MIHLMLKHITYKNSLSKVITKSFHPTVMYGTKCMYHSVENTFCISNIEVLRTFFDYV